MNRAVHVFAAVALVSACSGDHTPTAATLTSREMIRAAFFQDLATLRSVTAPFHDFEVARNAGWSAKITSCLVDPGGAGGMGFHYGNTQLIDGTAQVDKPQLLLYDPDASGRLRLVGVEYIIPYSFHSRDAAPPVLFGQPFLQFDAFQVWGLHAWVWEDNPSGIFAPWNPRVTCSNAIDVARMSHH